MSREIESLEQPNMLNLGASPMQPDTDVPVVLTLMNRGAQMVNIQTNEETSAVAEREAASEGEASTSPTETVAESKADTSASQTTGDQAMQHQSPPPTTPPSEGRSCPYYQDCQASRDELIRLNTEAQTQLYNSVALLRTMNENIARIEGALVALVNQLPPHK